jgi:hypothetical protein
MGSIPTASIIFVSLNSCPINLCWAFFIGKKELIMNIAWFMEDSAFSENLDPMKEEIVNQGMKVIESKYIPFEGGSYSHLFEGFDLVIFYGSLNLARQLSKENHPNLVIHSTVENYECTKYYAYLGEFLLNKDYMMIPFSEVERMKKFIFKMFGKKGQIFIRPSSGEKTFTGQLINEKEFEQGYTSIGQYDMKPESIVIISTPKDIVKEWRLVVSEGKIVTGSLYHDCTLNCNYIGYTEKVKKYAEKILDKKYNPDRIWTMDICQTRDEQIHLLEIGGFSCAGMYDGCMTNIITNATIVSK